jgi:two-component system CheB/CheR fusion protein
VVAEVSDNGVGIARNLLPHVFDAFEQGVRQREGLGLGLAISRALVELHGGEIFAESGGPGRGSTFRVMIPASAEPPTEAPPRRPSTPPELRKVGLSVLLVEDHVDSAQLMRELLELSGHRVEQACSITDALQLSENDSFDLLISDLGLPDGSGLELVRLLRGGGKVRHAIALSGYGMEEDLRRSREAGFEEHLVKPVNPRELDATIQRVTRQQA